MTETIQTINAYLAAHPYALRCDIAKAAGITRYKLNQLHEQGLIKLPKAISQSARAKIGRAIQKKSGKHFVINKNKPQVWQVVA